MLAFHWYVTAICYDNASVRVEFSVIIFIVFQTSLCVIYNIFQMESQQFLAENSASVYVKKVKFNGKTCHIDLAAYYCHYLHCQECHLLN